MKELSLLLCTLFILLLLFSFSRGVMAQSLPFNYEFSIDDNGNISIQPADRDPAPINQYGRFNLSIQFRREESDFKLLQEGYRNYSFLYQESESNKASVTQKGDNNTAVIIQRDSKEDDE